MDVIMKKALIVALYSRKLALAVLLSILGVVSSTAQVNFTGSTNTQWSEATNWSTGTVPSGTATDVTVATDVIISGGAYTIGNISQINNNTDLQVASGGMLTVGSSTLYSPPGSTTKKSITFANAGLLTVAGTLHIYGDLIVNNVLTFNITGTVIVYGNIVMDNGGDITVSGAGTLEVRGGITGGNNSKLTTSGSGTIAVTGPISLGGGSSSISGPPGSISAGGGCTCTGCAGSVCGNTVTPVELLFFNATIEAEEVVLNWQTASEKNFDYFSVERADTDLAFAEIGRVKGHGNSLVVNSYSFIDNNPIIGRSYYRLKSIDFDLYTESFEVVSVTFNGNKKLSVYPNPVSNGELRINANFKFDAAISAKITDLMGNLLLEFKIDSGSNAMNIDLKPGTYLIKISAPEFNSVSRFAVR
jgi:hypothetical protein